MKLYHGSYCTIDAIDLSHTRRYKGFGAGFYLTPMHGRAVTMAFRSVALNSMGSAEVNTYIFNKSVCPPDIIIKEFKTNDWEWAQFVMMNRDKSLVPPYAHDYDIVIGPVADSSVDPVIKEYKKDFGQDYLKNENLKILAKRLKYSGDRYIQYCFCTERALRQLIKD